MRSSSPSTLTRRGEHVFLGHGGSVAGYTAQAWVHRPSKTGVIVLRNAVGGRFQLGDLTFRALEERAKAAPPKPTAAAAIAESDSIR